MAMFQDPTKPRERPDTLVGDERRRAVSDLARLGMDTTNFTQQGLERLFSGSFVDSLGSARRAVLEQEDLGPLNYVTYSEPNNLAGYVEHSKPSDINLNLLHSYIPQTEANVRYTKERWERSPEDAARDVMLHEAFHSRKGGNDRPRNEEKLAEMFSTAFNVLAQARPEYTDTDYVNLFRDHWSKYAHGIGTSDFSGTGSREDPLVFKERGGYSYPKRDEILGMLDRVSNADVFADNPYRSREKEGALQRLFSWLKGEY